MKLTKFSDYAFKALMLAAARRDDRPTIEETARIFGISHGHVKKVVLALSRAGYLRGIKGRSGGYELSRPPEEISLGAVLRLTEGEFQMFDCVRSDGPCLILGACRLPAVTDQAVAAFLAVFDRMTLADLALPRQAFLPA